MRLPITLVTCLSLLGGAAATAQDVGEGALLYQNHCATCHGNDGLGFGPTASVLTIPPTDLTQLAAGNDGVFPTARVVYRIDGRDPLVAHGSPMPIFGPFFEGTDQAMRAETGQPILTSQPVADLVAYLELIQMIDGAPLAPLGGTD